TQHERQRYADIKPLVSNPWTVLHPYAPAADHGGPVAVDVPQKMDSAVRSPLAQEEERQPETQPAWHGTLLPNADADVWLAAAFAEYERIVSREHALQERRGKSSLTNRDREQLAASLFAERSGYLAAVSASGEVPLAQTHAAIGQSDWYHVAAGKGVLLLHALRRLVGASVFDDAMDSFGRAHAGKPVTVAEFVAHMQAKTGKNLGDFFEYWLTDTGIPKYSISQAKVTAHGKGYLVEGKLARTCVAPEADLPLTIETSAGEEVKMIPMTSAHPTFAFEVSHRPLRLVLDKHNTLAKANGGAFSIQSFHGELEHTLIVYGTADEEAANREAANALQRAIIERHSNFTVPIKTDRTVTDQDLQSHHLLLIGRPDSNTLVRRFQEELPIQFGARSFVVGKETYAHDGSAVLAAAANPGNKRFSLVVFAGLSAEATIDTVASWQGRGGSAAEVIVLPHAGRSKALVIPAKDLVKQLEAPLELTGRKNGVATSGR
ncbi:MAG TPA: M1 family aminopeptidase, partial [Gemmataceae bacterium]|nr:M1 family aminopeptidase [Gemmataceae bacterium]